MHVSNRLVVSWTGALPPGTSGKIKGTSVCLRRKLLEQDKEQRNATNKITIPAGPRLGDIVIEASGLTKGF